MDRRPSDFVPVARTAGLVVREFENELLIYDRSRDKALALNQLNAAVWKRCDGATPVAEVAEDVSRELGRPVTPGSVSRSIADLGRDRLLEDEAPAPRRGMSRRSMLVKTGVTVATIPVIARLALPQGVADAACTCSAGTACVLEACPDNTSLMGCHQGQACTKPGTSGSGQAASGCCGNPSGRAGCCATCSVCGICSGNVCQVTQGTVIPCQACTG
jgi:hypothetical protein